MTTNAVAPESYFVGTNSQTRHIEEAQRQGIVASDEKLLGLFDGIFFDEQGKRVGGLALNDYLVITNRQVTLWARDQFKDYVDHFPLAHVFIAGRTQKDALHGTLKLKLVLPDVEESQIDDGEAIEITFDFVPLPDLNLLINVLDVLGSLHRDMIAGGAGAEDRAKAALVMFNQVFVTPLKAGGKAKLPLAGTMPAYNNASAQAEEPLYTIEESEEDALMTPLSRLDALDGFSGPKRAAPNPLVPPTRGHNPPVARPVARPNPNQVGYSNESRLLIPGEQYASPETAPDQVVDPTSQAYSYTSGSLDNELRWFNGGVTDPFGYKQNSGSASAGQIPNASKAPGVKLREDLNPEGLYTIGRVGRAAWDTIDKLRREAETKSMGMIPGLNALRESGMNVREMTDFLVAVNNLMDTIGRNPAAREIAMTFLNRTLGAVPTAAKQPLVRSRGKDGLPIVEEGEEDGQSSSAGHGKGLNLKVEKRGRGEGGSFMPGGNVSQKVTIRHRTSNEAIDSQPENANNVEPTVENQPGSNRHRLPIRKKLPLEAEGTHSEARVDDDFDFRVKLPEDNVPTGEAVTFEEKAKPVPHRLAVHKKLPVGVGAADGGGDETELFDPQTATLKLPYSEPVIEEVNES